MTETQLINLAFKKSYIPGSIKLLDFVYVHLAMA